MNRSLCWVSFLTLVISACRPIPIAARRWLGCYETTLGAWSRDPRQSAPPHYFPDTIVLTGRLAVLHSDTLGYELEPQLFDAERSEVSAWKVTDDTVRLTWTDGYTGVRVWLSPSDSGLIGRAEYTTDVIHNERLPDGTVRPIPWPGAGVRLRPIRCGSLAAEVVRSLLPNTRLKLAAPVLN